MAFYTSRVDDEGNEIERRQSARSLQSSYSSGSSKQNITSSRSLDNNAKTSVRYVNQAAFIEKNSDQSDTASSIDLMTDRSFMTRRISHDSRLQAGGRSGDTSGSCDMMISDRKYMTGRSDTASHSDVASSIDMISERHLLGSSNDGRSDAVSRGGDTASSRDKFLTHRMTPHDGRSDIVPPLDLQSEENYQGSARDYTFSYRKHCEVAKVRPDVAYQTWLSAKRKLLSDEASRRKQDEEEKRHKEQERRQQADRKFEEWLKMKSRQSAAAARNCSGAKATKPAQPKEQQMAGSSSAEMTDTEAKAKLEEWKRKKEALDEERRALKRQEEEMQRALEEQRRLESNAAWSKWIADADKKPKPVPLNRGILTLRGTVSDIFVNPNEWQSSVTVEHDN